MKRRLTNLATWVSLVLCVAFAFAWVRSVFRNDNAEGSFGSGRPVRYLSVESNSGQLAVAYMPRCPWPYRWEWKSSEVTPSDRRWFAPCPGFRSDVMRFMTLEQNATPVPADYYFLSVPYWLLVGLAGAPPALRLWPLARTARRRRRTGQGLCVRCGYDLRASPDRCPECGDVPAVTGGPAA